MTADQVKAKFAREGRTFSDWARENNLSYSTVLAVLNGGNKGRRGEAHRVAVALGIKKQEAA
jgi:gp16 family phage-associated protein